MYDGEVQDEGIMNKFVSDTLAMSEWNPIDMELTQCLCVCSGDLQWPFF
jgi:hypothetical protein